jgi:hypothetical protein
MPEDKVSESADKGAVSAKKAADTAEAYEQASGQADKPESDSDPVMDAINEATADIEQPESQEAPINPDYEKDKEEAFENREVDEDVDTDNEAPADEKPAAKKTAAKKS